MDTKTDRIVTVRHCTNARTAAYAVMRDADTHNQIAAYYVARLPVGAEHYVALTESGLLCGSSARTIAARMANNANLGRESSQFAREMYADSIATTFPTKEAMIKELTAAHTAD